MIDVRGRCPACNWATLFLGDGGHVTCSRLECPDPSAADDLLHRSASTAELREDLAAALAAKIDGTEGCANRYRLADAALAALTEHLDISDAEAWCKICRRVWDSKRHRCESNAEQRLTHIRDIATTWFHEGDPGPTRTAGEFLLSVIDGPPAPGTAATQATDREEQPNA